MRICFALAAAVLELALLRPALGKGFLSLSAPRRVLTEGQEWERGQYPHTLSVVELNRGGYRYWGWYGLSGGIGIGLARSNDLVTWTKDPDNPLLMSARWPSVVAADNADRPALMYMVFDYTVFDSPAQSDTAIVLADSEDGRRLHPVKVLVRSRWPLRSQNPNLFRDPVSGRYYLTWYRGDNKDRFEIVSRSAGRVSDLDRSPDRVLLVSSETIAAPTLLYVAGSSGTAPIYYLATETFPGRFAAAQGQWQVRVFSSTTPDGDYSPVAGNPVLSGERACLFQHVFSGHFYGYNCHILKKHPGQPSEDEWVLEETDAPLHE